MICRVSLLLLSALLIVAGANRCPSGWTRYEKRCFTHVSTSRSWAEAERQCLLMGGNLASVHSLNEYHFIQRLINRASHGTPLTWLGGHDAVQEGVWLWSDGSRFGFTHWAPNEPNNKHRPENCLQMNLGGTLQWNDEPCYRSYPSVCSLTPK